jgi:hypothetical protein
LSEGGFREMEVHLFHPDETVEHSKEYHGTSNRTWEDAVIDLESKRQGLGGRFSHKWAIEPYGTASNKIYGAYEICAPHPRPTCMSR